MTEEEVKAEEVKAHETTTSMLEAVPAELEAGADIALKVKVSCSSACDLRGKIVKIITPDAVVKQMEIELAEFDGTANETDEFVLKAPIKPGVHMWTALFPVQEKEGVLHEESSAPFSFIVKSHATSMAVWDAPSPIVIDTKFKVKVGVKCSANCRLTDQKIEIYDQEGGKLATGTLGGVPWSAIGALYWTEVELEAPSTEGYYTWEAKFLKPDLKLPHEEASYPFRFGTAMPPEHMVTVQVIDNNEKLPIMEADVLLRPLKVPGVSVSSPPYKASTDESGVASVGVPEGTYKLYATMDDYLTFERNISVDGDVIVKVELIYRPVVKELT